jgi:guanosine-3',5'-bis(diphosphate) 3'-pyrophosphohydrolase
MNLPSHYSEDEKKAIASEYRSLMRLIKIGSKDPNRKKIRRAFEIAVTAHQNQRRKSNEPYIHHPIAVAKIVAGEVGLGATSVICALLHDTVEDTEYTLEEIQEEFGEHIAKMIDGLTKIDNLTASSQSVQAENFRKIIFTLGDDIRVIIIKLADRLHNMRTLDSVSQRNQHKIASETLFLYAPLAHRLGLYSIKTELEDLSMKYTETELYKEIASKINQKKKERTRFINEFCKPIRVELENAGLKARVYGRPKSIASIANKMVNKGVEFESVYDLFAIRIVIDCPVEEEKSDIWRAYSIVAANYEPNPKRFRNWVSNPKANGYESLHTTVMGPGGRWVEVQIRTERMDEVAEKGLAAHFKYKEGGVSDSVDKAFEDWLMQVRDLLKNPDMNPLEFMSEFKMQLYAQEIYVFTPKGEVKNLPKGSTALDFAFMIHSAVGSKCIGAKVNGKLEPISHVLTNGDQIEILTSNKQKPNEGWIKIAFTSRAKNKIKQSLKEERKIMAEDGKELLLRKLKSNKVTFNGDNIQFLTTFFDVPSALDLYYDIAVEKIDLSKLKELTVEGGNFVIPKHKPKAVIKTVELSPRKAKKKSKSKEQNIILFGDESENYAYEFAKCCSPIPGDDVLGFISATGGVKIHRAKCPNIIHSSAQYGYRVIKPSWASQGGDSFLASITLKGTDDMGIISSLTTIISNDFKVNIKGMNIETEGNVFLGYLKLFVKSNDQLKAIIKRIKEINGIISVVRNEEQAEE